jgi:hypothetical protein
MPRSLGVLSSKHVQLLSLWLYSLRTEPSTLDGHHAPSGSNSPVMSYHSHHSHPRSNSHSPKASGMVSADFDSARYTYTPENRHISSSSHHHHKCVYPWNLLQSSRHISLGIIRIRLYHHTIREITIYPIMLDIRLRNHFTILLVRGRLIHINLTNDQVSSSIRRILTDRIQIWWHNS